MITVKTPVVAAGRFALMALAVTALSGGFARATPVLDQSQMYSDIGLVLGDSNVTYGQSFTAGMSGTLDEIDVGLNLNTASRSSFKHDSVGQLTLDIYAGNGPTITSGNLLGSVASTIGSGVFDFSTANIDLTAGNSYTFAVLGGSGSIQASNQNSYAAGSEFFLYDGKGFYADTAGLDMVFQTFVEAAAVPEPATLALFGVGLAGLCLLRRNGPNAKAA